MFIWLLQRFQRSSGQILFWCTPGQDSVHAVTVVAGCQNLCYCTHTSNYYYIVTLSFPVAMKNQFILVLCIHNIHAQSRFTDNYLCKLLLYFYNNKRWCEQNIVCGTQKWHVSWTRQCCDSLSFQPKCRVGLKFFLECIFVAS